MGRWIVNSVSHGVASSEAELVLSLEGSTLPSSEAEVRFAVEGLGEGASSEAEIVSRVRGGVFGWAVPQSWVMNWASYPSDQKKIVGLDSL